MSMNEVPKKQNTARERKSFRWSLEAFSRSNLAWGDSEHSIKIIGASLFFFPYTMN